MPDLDERIRIYVDTAQPTVTIDEIRTYLTQNQSTVRTPSRRAWLLGSSLVAAGIAALVAALLAFPNDGPGKSPPASAATILRHAAMVADSQQPLVPGPGQFLYVRLLDGGREASELSPIADGGRTLSRYYVQEALEQWTSPTGSNRQAFTVVGQPEFITEADRQLWEHAGSPLIESGYGGGGTPPYYDVTNLPTDPSKMSTYFASQADLVQTAGGQLNTLWDFSTAAAFLENGASGPQRAALLEYMASIPGVSDSGSGTTLGTEQTGTIFAMPSTVPGFTFQVIIDQTTSEVLEQRLVVSDPSKLDSPTPAQVTAGRAVAPLQIGQAEQYQDLLYTGIADSSSAVPKGAPPSPAPWPYGTGREPLPGSAYSLNAARNATGRSPYSLDAQGVSGFASVIDVQRTPSRQRTGAPHPNGPGRPFTSNRTLA